MVLVQMDLLFMNQLARAATLINGCQVGNMDASRLMGNTHKSVNTGSTSPLETRLPVGTGVARSGTVPVSINLRARIPTIPTLITGGIYNGIMGMKVGRDSSCRMITSRSLGHVKPVSCLR